MINKWCGIFRIITSSISWKENELIFIYSIQLTLYHQILQHHLQMQYQVDKQDIAYAKQYDMLLECMY
jgi:hypothetical protein